jgi:hypothetical protein
MGRYSKNLRPEEIIALRSEISESGCWLWKGRLNAKGYGSCCGGLAHRFAYRTLVGAIPDGLYVLHHCDTRNCVNPQHLYVGTQKDNVADMWRRGRANHRGQRPGEGHSLAKLTWDKVIEIRRRRAIGETQQKLADEFGVGREQIAKIDRNERWKVAP